jgi:hypothetical protein
MSGSWGITPEEQPEFDEIFAVAITLGIRNKKKKAEKVEKILECCTKEAVSQLVLAPKIFLLF